MNGFLTLEKTTSPPIVLPFWSSLSLKPSSRLQKLYPRRREESPMRGTLDIFFSPPLNKTLYTISVYTRTVAREGKTKRISFNEIPVHCQGLTEEPRTGSFSKQTCHRHRHSYFFRQLYHSSLVHGGKEGWTTSTTLADMKLFSGQEGGS